MWSNIFVLVGNESCQLITEICIFTIVLSSRLSAPVVVIVNQIQNTPHNN